MKKRTTLAEKLQRDQEIVDMRYAGKDYKEIMNALHCSGTAVSAALKAAGFEVKPGQRQKPKPKPKSYLEDFVATNGEAKKRGLSYGDYVALERVTG